MFVCVNSDGCSHQYGSAHKHTFTKGKYKIYIGKLSKCFLCIIHMQLHVVQHECDHVHDVMNANIYLFLPQ